MPEQITVGPQANFTLLDQMSELKKIQSKSRSSGSKYTRSLPLDASDQTSTDKLLEEEEEILRNVGETRGTV